MNIQGIADKVSRFMESHPSGWVKEEEARSFLDTECSLTEVCIALSQLTDSVAQGAMLSFLENIVHYEAVAEMFTHLEFKPYVAAASTSPSERLRTIVVRALSCVRRPALPLEIDASLFMGLLRDEDTSISQSANKLVVKWASGTIKDLNSKIEFVGRIIAYFKANESSLNETEKFRFVALFIELSQLHESIFERISRESVLSSIVDEFLSNESDLLVKLGSLTFIESLARFEAGQRFLADSNVLHALERELTGPLADSTTVISILFSIASILPFITDRDQVRYILTSPSSQVPSLLVRFITSANNAERMCAMKVFGQLAVGADKSDLIETFLRTNWKSLNEIEYAMSDVDVEVVNSAVDSIRTMVKHWSRNLYMESEASQNRLVEDVLNTLRRHPFPECRCLIYSLLSVMLLDEDFTDSALTRLLSDPSPIRAALLDYKSESNYDSRTAKCDFVRVLVKSEEKHKLRRFFKKDEVENFIDFAKKGLEWVPISAGKDEMETEAM